MTLCFGFKLPRLEKNTGEKSSHELSPALSQVVIRAPDAPPGKKHFKATTRNVIMKNRTAPRLNEKGPGISNPGISPKHILEHISYTCAGGGYGGIYGVHQVVPQSNCFNHVLLT